MEQTHDTIDLSTNIKSRADLTLDEKRAIRTQAGARNNVLVVVVDGSRSPEEAGEGCHYETMGGQYIRYPSAYSKRGWSNMRYCPSTLRVEVGAEWVRGLRATIASASQRAA